MGSADPRIGRYLSKDRPWRAEMVAIRAILLSEPLTETLKWRSPCYTAHGQNVLMMDALKDAAFVSFFKGVLLEDPERRLEPPGPNSRSARYMKFASVQEVAADAARLRGFVRHAIGNAAAGRAVDLPPDDLAPPDELLACLEADPGLAAAWAGLTPGRRRGWALQFAGARAAATRRRRIEKARAAILAGRGPHDR